jgi:hypothetical protein
MGQYWMQLGGMCLPGQPEHLLLDAGVLGVGLVADLGERLEFRSSGGELAAGPDELLEQARSGTVQSRYLRIELLADRLHLATGTKQLLK